MHRDLLRTLVDPLQRSALWRGLALWSLLALTAFCYLPSLTGPFIFDDLPNLMGLARISAPFDADFWTFTTYGIAGPTGRPLALLSFALQHAAWPVDPAAFHRVSLALHLVTGALCALLVLRLAAQWWPGERGRAEALAVVAAGLWLIHPIQVSTVAFVVQRMTIMATLFTVLGLLAWTHGRQLVARAPERAAGYLWAAAGMGGGGLLAVLSKETGVLLLAYALVLEHCVYRGQPVGAGWRRARHLLLHAPALAFCALVAWRWQTLIADKYVIREFDLVERLLTQPRVLLDYLGLIVVPTPSRLTLFHDDYLASRGLLEPAATLPALALVLGLAAVGWWLRARAPVLAFALLWFFAGHLLESTFLPLELFFEHRNYLPLLGPAVAAAYYGQLALSRLTTRHARVLVPALFALLALGLAVLTRVEAEVWGRPKALAQIWAVEHPTSLRARANYAGVLKELGHHEAAAAEYRRMVEDFPRDAGPMVEWYELGCLSPTVELPERRIVLERLRSARFSYAPTATIDRIVTEYEDDGECGRVFGSDVLAMLDALDANPTPGDAPELVPLLRGRLFKLRGDWRGALVQFDEAMARRPRLDVATLRVIVAVDGGDLALARRYLDEALALARRSPVRGIAILPRLEDWDAKLRLVESPPRPSVP
jgi:tetratricopeptide (TPR) repeat protein